MKKRLPLVLALVLVGIAIVVWRTRGGDDAPPAPPAPGSAAHAAAADSARVVSAASRPDPKTLGRGSLAGTVTVDDATRAPIAGAQVCAYGTSHVLATELLRQPTCATTDAGGHYTLANLLPAEYAVGANAKTFRPAVFHPDGDRKRDTVVLAAGEAKTGIDLALRTGGVEITGSVLDLTGGVVAHARVWSGRERRVLGSTETDERGRFSMWVAPDYTTIHATADGYDESEEWIDPPAKDIEIVLTPESALAGTVIDAASGQPVEGARVQLGDWNGAESTFSDAQGKFRLGKLSPGRYVIYARTDHAYGRTEGSSLVGLGQNVDGVIVKLYPAARVTGKVIIAATKQVCTEAVVSLRDPKTDRYVNLRRSPDGALWAEGVLPGDYDPSVECSDYQEREKYDRVTVGTKDILDLVWEVDAGATIRGKVLTRSGTPIEDASVWARSVGGAGRAKVGWASDSSGRDGAYSLEGLRPGSYKVEVSSDKGAGAKDGYKVEVAAGAVIEKDLVLDDVGAIRGVVVDQNGAPVTKVNASAYLVSGGGRGWANRETDESGSFTLEGLRPGEYRVSAARGWNDALKKPGATDDAKKGEKVTVKANQVASVRIVVEALSGTIKGTVVDTANQPVTDAFLSAVRESDAAGAQRSVVSESRWQWGEKPVLTATDGTFTIDKLAPGNYTIRAFRRGGGEAVAEHVPVNGSAKLQIKPTGAIRGVAKLAAGDTASLTELEITLEDRKTGFWRREGFYMTEGRFAIEDLPQGSFDLSAQVPGSRKTIPITLAEGEEKTGVSVELEGSITLHGRLVEYGTTKPVAGVRMMAQPIVGVGDFGWGNDDEPNVTDDSGAFTIERAPRGRIHVRGYPKDWNESDYSILDIIRTPGADGDLGDVGIMRKRVKRGDAVGELGVHFVDQPEETLPDEREMKISWIDPNGPAAKVDLKVGDVVTSIDGIDVAGPSYASAWPLLRAAPGTKLVLGLARNATVSIILAAP